VCCFLELGELGPQKGTPIRIEWPWTNHLWSFLPLALLGLPFLVPRNRRRGVAAVWLPVLAVYFAWVPLRGVFGDVLPDMEVMLGCFAVGLGTAAAMLPWLATGSRWRSWLRTLLAAFLVQAAALVLFSGGRLAALGEWGAPPVMTVMVTSIVVTAGALTRGGGDDRVGVDRTLLRFLKWVLLCAAGAIALMVLLAARWSDPGVEQLGMLTVMIGILTTLCLVLTSPFLLLAAFPTYRERFREALGGA